MENFIIAFLVVIITRLSWMFASKKTGLDYNKTLAYSVPVILFIGFFILSEIVMGLNTPDAAKGIGILSLLIGLYTLALIIPQIALRKYFESGVYQTVFIATVVIVYLGYVLAVQDITLSVILVTSIAGTALVRRNALFNALRKLSVNHTGTTA